MSTSLRRSRALVYTYADRGTNGETLPTYVRSPSSAADFCWWCSTVMPTGREVTTGMKPEHRIDLVLSFASVAPVTNDGLLVIDGVQYFVRAILNRDHGKDEVQVYAECNQSGTLAVVTV